MFAFPQVASAGSNSIYTFTFTPIPGFNGSASGWFEVASGGGDLQFPDTIVNVGGFVSGFGSGNGTITGILSPNTYLSNDNFFSSSDGSSYLDNFGVGFQTDKQFNMSYYDDSWQLQINASDPVSTGSLAISLSQ